jgi:hypothetical protein
MNMQKFSEHICDQLAFYVYRLLDPRNGATFYVGKGKGNRLFHHIAGAARSRDEELSDKIQRINEIKNAGLEVGHVVHRHGLDEKTAHEVEAALIDAYPEVMNEVGGHGSDDRGILHSQEIIERYEAPKAVFKHKVLAITVNNSVIEKSAYEAVRYAWKVDPVRAQKAEFVLAVTRGLIVGVYVARKWMAATPRNFPGTPAPREGRYGFVGTEATSDVLSLYLRHRLPDSMRRRGAANPVKYNF